jgi:hypothetical protein
VLGQEKPGEDGEDRPKFSCPSSVAERAKVRMTKKKKSILQVDVTLTHTPPTL